MLTPLLAARNLTFAWGPGLPPVLDGINLALDACESVGLLGENGSGKTTLFRCLTGLIKIRGGEIRLNGQLIQKEQDFAALRKTIGFCLQNPEDQIIFPTVLEDVSFGPLNLGCTPAQARDLARDALDLVGLPGFADRLTNKLSGGEQRLAALAGILAMRPRAILFDEPLNELDRRARARVEEIISGLECAKIIISHDRDFIDRLCGRKLFLQNGRLRAFSL